MAGNREVIDWALAIKKERKAALASSSGHEVGAAAPAFSGRWQTKWQGVLSSTNRAPRDMYPQHCSSSFPSLHLGKASPKARLDITAFQIIGLPPDH
ncbi:unnamed protein product [Polarella glacialis]|nr:unnamed protein product [Polarella glacialis]